MQSQDCVAHSQNSEIAHLQCAMFTLTHTCRNPRGYNLRDRDKLPKKGNLCISCKIAELIQALIVWLKLVENKPALPRM